MNQVLTSLAMGHPGWNATVLEPAMAGIDFYATHFAGANLQDLPTFDKHATAGYGQFPLSAGGPSGAFRVVATSGTTGDRMYVAFDRADWDRVGAWVEQVGRRTGLTDTDVLLNTHCYGLWVGGPILDLLAVRSGACPVPLGPGPPSGVLHMLAGGVGSAISATPSYLRRLVEAADATGFDLTRSPLRVGFIGAEVAEPALRSALLKRLPPGFAWVELYGLTETFGPSVAFAPDPDVAELELNTADFQVEILDPCADTPVGVGEVGELTLTSRRPSRSPLIRYRTKDLVRVVSGSADAPVRVSRILGRADDAVKIGGVLMYPTAVAEIVTAVLPPTAEWRGTVRRYRSADELLIEVEGSNEQRTRVETTFHERLGMDVTVRIADRDALVRSREKTSRITVEVLDGDTDGTPRSGCG